MSRFLLRWCWLACIVAASVTFSAPAQASQADIHGAVRDGDLEAVRAALAGTPELVRSVDSDGRTPLHLACRSDNLPMVELLLASGAGIDAKDAYLNTPLHYLGYRDLADAAARLIEQGANVDVRNHEGMTPLHSAALADANAVVKLLAAAGANLDARNERGRTPLILCARERGGVDTARTLIDAGCDLNAVDAYGSSALDLAAWRGKEALVDLLLDTGAEITTDDEKGRKLLAEAAENGLTRLFAAAVESGLDPKFETASGGSLVHQAAAGGALEILEQLASLGFDTDHQDRSGWTPLHYAARDGREACVRWLLDRKAASDIRNAGGETPFNVAEEMGAGGVAAILRDAGADTSTVRFPELRGPYLGQEPPGTTPIRFAPGIVSSVWNLHSSVSFSPQGDVAMWAPMVVVPGEIYARGGVMVSRLQGGRWTRPEWAGFTGPVDGDVPFVAPDGERVYFISTRPDAKTKSVKERIWFADRRDGGWGPARPVNDKVNDLPLHWQFSVAADGTLYFGLDLPAGLGGGDIYRSRLVDGSWTAPEPLGPPVNSTADESTPFIAPDESYLIVQRDGDLYLSLRGEGGSWGAPEALGEPINSSARELCPIVSPDGKYLFFLSNRGGASHVWWVRADFLPAAEPGDRSDRRVQRRAEMDGDNE